ncbi:transglycosylase SLT domain-containing protein [Burkholderia gladioli]|uniref:transglycosylase SLT domain-containing protein n=1 Tax=Burkholderia gladioli TaxID=28095 RepID=UPI00163E90DC|nr:transglycosylase SLT domain-containing protein [Burkholderia gladioli]MBU9197268.1 transglycosylase SLT domain-containing protein [Burkholderia gladioli]MBU9213335.1 transglycosylase SLT domain-containing protein [Burkholderia gladioli]MBU9379466.1 transglycosylase SLT domain-containing protein [Burkholderia gladioli]MDN7724376.1 transglycosylase SLT domain-containing protein [Burkholderia gladioli]
MMGISQHQKRGSTGRRARRGALAAASLLVAMPGLARADCIDDAASFQHVNVGLMRAIAQVESGTRTNVISPNSNGTYDIGLMQINSSWLPRLAREGITQQSLLDPCTNAYVAAWILSQNIQQFGPTWNAIGAYNASSPDKRLAYAQKVYDTAQSIISTQDVSMPIIPPSFTPPQTYNPFASLGVSQVKMAPANGASGSTPRRPAPAPAPDAAPGTYNFGWTVTGADDAKPVQVFDDGARIYVQFSDMKRVPAIFGDTPRGRVILRWDPQPPYAVIATLEPKLVFQIGQAEAIAQRAPAAITPKSAGSTSTQAGAAPTRAPAVPGSNAVPATAAVASAAAARKAATASTDALWYLSTPSSRDNKDKALASQTLPVADTGTRNDPPPAAQAPVATATDKPTTQTPSPRNTGTDALFYLTK